MQLLQLQAAWHAAHETAAGGQQQAAAQQMAMHVAHEEAYARQVAQYGHQVTQPQAATCRAYNGKS